MSTPDVIQTGEGPGADGAASTMIQHRDPGDEDTTVAPLAPRPTLALDVSTTRCGAAHGTSVQDLALASIPLGPLTPKGEAKWPRPQRLQLLTLEIDRLLDAIKPASVAIECPDGKHSYSSGHQSSLALGQAVGIAFALCTQRRLPVTFWDAQQVRFALLGRREATKEAVQWYLKQLHIRLPWLGDNLIDHDAADAAALWVADDDHRRRLALIAASEAAAAREGA